MFRLLGTISLSVLRARDVSADCLPLASTARSLSALGLVVCLVATPGLLHAQSVSTDDSRTQAGATELETIPSLGILAGRPTVRVGRTETPPDIDGRLDDVAWQTAATITELVQYSPFEGEPATEDTEVYIAYDSQHIYFGFYLHYTDPSILRANRVDRDRAAADDLMTIYLDTFMDQQRSYDFDINAYNVQGDGIVNLGRGGRSGIPPADRSWDGLFSSAAQIVEDGYIAEMAIPFKTLRYPQRPTGTPHRWGFQIVREIKGKNQENDVWAPMSRGVAGFMTQMGVLEGMTDLSTSRNIEILPTFTAVQFGSLDETTGEFSSDTTPEGGVNFKYGITSNLTTDFTLNPDFSQIESDRPQISVNQRFPLFFPELRPFFLEGQEIFSFTSPVDLVHTRTIVDPNYGAKLTGKVGRTTLGVIFADDEAPGKRDDLADPAFGQTARTFIGRARYDLYAESHIGALVTDREFVDGYSRVAGIDGQFRIGQTDQVNFVAFQSQHRDEEGQEGSGPVLGAYYNHNGRSLRFSSFVGSTDPEFGTDVGFVRRVDTRTARSDASYRWWPETWLINWGPRLSYERIYDFEGVLQDEEIETGMNFSFARNIRGGVSANRSLERFGGIDFWKSRFSLNANASTSRRFSVRGGFSWGDQIFFDPDNPFLGRSLDARVNVTLRPVPRLQSEISANMTRFTDPRNGDLETFNVKIFRALSTYAFTDRLLVRNITEYDTFDKTLDLNILFTYRVNAGTVFYVGYDDHYQQADFIDEERFPTTDLRRTNRAVFTKLQYLFRY